MFKFFDFEEGVVVVEGGFTLLAVIEVLADAAFVACSYDRAFVAPVADVGFVDDLLFFSRFFFCKEFAKEIRFGFFDFGLFGFFLLNKVFDLLSDEVELVLEFLLDKGFKVFGRFFNGFFVNGFLGGEFGQFHAGSLFLLHIFFLGIFSFWDFLFFFLFNFFHFDEFIHGFEVFFGKDDLGFNIGLLCRANVTPEEEIGVFIGASRADPDYEFLFGFLLLGFFLFLFFGHSSGFDDHRLLFWDSDFGFFVRFLCGTDLTKEEEIEVFVGASRADPSFSFFFWLSSSFFGFFDFSFRHFSFRFFGGDSFFQR